jgi:hypothetical protein
MNPTFQNGKPARNHWSYGTSYAFDIQQNIPEFVSLQFRTQVGGPDAVKNTA